MHVRHRLLVVAFLSAGLCHATAFATDLPLPERSLTGLESILRHAAAQSPRMINRTLDLEIAENNRLQARAGILPHVSAYYRHYETQDERADVTGQLDASKVYYDVSITQPLFHWGERRNNVRIGELQKAIAEGNYREAYRGLAQELRQRYLSLVVSRQYVVRARHALQLARQTAALAEQRLAKREISEVEAFPIRLAVEQGQIALERSEFDFEMARQSFARLAGLPRMDEAALPEDIPAIPSATAAIDTLLAGYLSQSEPATPDAVNQRTQLKIEELNYQNQKTRLRPKISLAGGINQDETSYTLNTAQKYRVTSVYAGFTVSWTLFDGFAAQAGTRNALARRRQAENDYAETVNRLGQQAQTQARQLNFAARHMAITDRAYTSAEGHLRSKRDEFQRGLISEADLGAVELSLIDARIAAFNARIDYFTRIGDFLGTLARDPAASLVQP